ncbi:hypothetical protein HN587_02375 [Candidatus Woesearchaeota archaeon]|jgi:hypothetical protein|nr:hypothetical protein [Candidatus Woesearchaeota archaeon]
MKIVTKIKFWILLIIFSISFISAVSAEGPPLVPFVLWGELVSDSQEISDYSVAIKTSDGDFLGEVDITETKMYSLSVPWCSELISSGCVSDGTKLDFYVNGEKKVSTYTVSASGAEKFDIIVGVDEQILMEYDETPSPQSSLSANSNMDSELQTNSLESAEISSISSEKTINSSQKSEKESKDKSEESFVKLVSNSEMSNSNLVVEETSEPDKLDNLNGFDNGDDEKSESGFNWLVVLVIVLVVAVIGVVLYFVLKKTNLFK